MLECPAVRSWVAGTACSMRGYGLQGRSNVSRLRQPAQGIPSVGRGNSRNSEKLPRLELPPGRPKNEPPAAVVLVVVVVAAEDGGGAAVVAVVLVAAAAEAEELSREGRARRAFPRAGARLGPMLLMLGPVAAMVRSATGHHRRRHRQGDPLWRWRDLISKFPVLSVSQEFKMLPFSTDWASVQQLSVASAEGRSRRPMSCPRPKKAAYSAVGCCEPRL